MIVLLPLILGGLSLPVSWNKGPDSFQYESNSSSVLPQIEVGDDEVLHKMVLSDLPVTQQGSGSALNGSEYGIRTDHFESQNMRYDSASSTTSGVNLSVPMATNWQAHEIYSNVTNLTQNRTWIENPGFDNGSVWTYGSYDGPSHSNPGSAFWDANGHGAGDGSSVYQINEPPSRHYDVTDKAYSTQNIQLTLGEIVWVGISVDYYAVFRNLAGTLTGYFELFLSIGDPDSGGSYLWSIQFNEIQSDGVWYSTEIVDVDPGISDFTDATIYAGLRVTGTVRYGRSRAPEGRLDNIEIYIKSKTTPSALQLQMNGNDVQGSTPGEGQINLPVELNQMFGTAYANFSWTPLVNPPVPDLDIIVEMDVEVSVFARSYKQYSINDTSALTPGELYAASNGTDIRWETNFLAVVPGGYNEFYFYNLSLPANRDIEWVSEPDYRHVNLTNGWYLGDPGDYSVNVSAHEVTTENLDGLWLLKGSSPNLITQLEVWDSALGWTRTNTFRAGDVTRFNATIPSGYENNVVKFTIYAPDGTLWHSMEATISSGFAVSDSITLGALNASVGMWEVQAFVDDGITGNGEIHNIGFFRRAFAVQHSTVMSVRYPLGSEVSWSKNVTYGDFIILQFRVNDSDNSNLLPGGLMTYSWAGGSGSLIDLGTGEYKTTLDTSVLSSNGQFDVNIEWTGSYYDSLSEVFTLNVIYRTSLGSANSSGVTAYRYHNVDLSLYYEDQLDNPITDAAISCNWSLGSYQVTPVAGSPGYYTLTLEIGAAPISPYAIGVNASKDFYESRSIVIRMNVRETRTTATPSSSDFVVPIGHSFSLNITYWDVGEDLPISGSESSISCNWSDSHGLGDANYTVVETSVSGKYEVTIYTLDTDTLGFYPIQFSVSKPGFENHTFSISMELRTHLATFDLFNPIEPVSMTGTVSVHVLYFDWDGSIGITGSSVDILVTTDEVIPLQFSWTNGSTLGEYVISIAASQWPTNGTKTLYIDISWTGPTVKYPDLSVTAVFRIKEAATEVFIGQSPVLTPYGNNVTFTLVYWDSGNGTGIVNGTGPYAGNVRIFVEVLTAGQSLDQTQIEILEIDYDTNPGEYSFNFNSTHLSGIVSCQLRIWFNWTAGAIPYYVNQSLLLTVYSTYRQTSIDWTPIPVTPYDEIVDLSLTYRDALSGLVIRNSTSLLITTPGYAFSVLYEGDLTGVFVIRIDTSQFLNPGSHSFQIEIFWSGAPFYQNRTVDIQLDVRERYTELTHGSYEPIQYGNLLTLVFTYTDLDSFSTAGMNNGALTLLGIPSQFYTVDDNGDGTYTLTLQTDYFLSLGTFIVNASITYGGTRFCSDATDYFYLSIVERRTQLTSDIPDLAPFLALANITVQYTDDSTGIGIAGAMITVSCDNSTQALVLNSNYFVSDLGDGTYKISIETVALGAFGTYNVQVTANWTGSPFYQERIRATVVVVSRRPASIIVSKSPLNSPYLDNVEFVITVMDSIDASPILLDKSVLIISHGAGFLLPDSQYTLSGASGVYTIAINSTVLSPILVSDHPINIALVWGDVAPFYANATTSTQATITSRFTQGRVLATPGAHYFYNLTADIEFSDYLTSDGITGAIITFECSNASSFSSWVYDLGDGTYRILVDTNDLPGLGRYLFTANISWVGSPYYENVIGLDFAVLVNPVSTSLSFVLPLGVTYFLGDVIYGNITFTDILEGKGIDGALIGSDWNATYPSICTVTPIGGGIYTMAIYTDSLNAGLYTFNVTASKFRHLNRSITADILVATIPVDIELDFDPTNPVWGDSIQLSANITNTLSGLPVVGADVNLTLSSVTYNMADMGAGIYNVTISTKSFVSGEYTIRVSFELLNYGTRQKDFQIRIEKVSARITASLDSPVAVNGQFRTITAHYLMLSNDTAIDIGLLSYSWIGGIGNLTWNPIQLAYVGQFLVDNADNGNHQILIQASSSIYKTVTISITVEVTESVTATEAYEGLTVLSAVSGDAINVTVYLNNTNLNLPVLGADVSFGISDFAGDLTEIGGGYYSAMVPTGTLQIGDWILTVSSDKAGFLPSSTQFTISIIKVQTEVVLLSDAILKGYYGSNVTFYLYYNDTHNNLGISNASATYVFEQTSGTLSWVSNGTYSLTVNTSWVPAGFFAHDISITFQKDLYEYAYSVVKLVSDPIPTEVIGPVSVSVPIGDDFTQLFQFNDTLHGILLDEATATAFWEFGTDALTPMGGGTYRFGPSEVNMSRLAIRSEPYTIRIQFSRSNYSVQELILHLTIREIRTEIVFAGLPAHIYVAGTFYVRVHFMDLDHNLPITGASNLTTGLSNIYELATDFGNGTYIFAFSPLTLNYYELRITLEKTDYQIGELVLDIYAELSPQTQALVQGFTWGSLLLILIAGFAAAYVRIWSVPKLLRIIRKMVASLNKGTIPAPADVNNRRTLLLEYMNQELAPIAIMKTSEDIAPSTIEVIALDVENLLEELQLVVGLSDSDISTLREDLGKMRPSERAGFIGEVVRQERARRAREITVADLEEEGPEAVAEAERRLTENELEHLREQLIAMGIEPSEADLMVEQAKALTKAEIDALLEEIGGDEQ
jgi:hypothetical protein